MGILSGVCGVLIVVFGLFTTRHSPNDAQFGTEVTCLVGGLVLVFLGVLLSRLDRLGRRIDGGSDDRSPPAA